MNVPESGGPFTATVVNFVDAKGNPTTDTDTPTWASSDPTVATVAVGATPDTATVTLAGKIGPVSITATFPKFVVTGSLDVVAGPAVSATMTIM